MKINPYAGEAWLGEAPDIDESMIKRTVEADVVIIGGGLAGVAALRRATELGATAILLEKCSMIQARSGDFAVMDSRVADTWGRRDVDKVRIVNDLMTHMCYLVSQRILNRWAQEAGQAFDWYLEGYPDIPVLRDTRAIPPEGAKCWIMPRRMPLPEHFDQDSERFKCYQTTVWVRPTHIPVLRGNYALAMHTGRVQSFFNAPVQKLLRDGDGHMRGAIARLADGTYLKALCRKSVVLCTGDYMSNPRMLRRFCPGMVNTPQLWIGYDKNRVPSNTGDGHRMGMWIGAKLQDQPHAPVAHHMGSVFGASGFLLLNSRGQRFVNEDAPGQQIGDQIEALPDKTAWQFVDGGWFDQVGDVYPCHGSVCFPVTDEALSGGGIYPKLSAIDNFVSPGLVQKAVEAGELLRADTLEEAVAYTGMDAQTALSSIARYNQMCAQGRDDDFGKRPLRLFPVARPPFYVAKFVPATMIAVMGGLESDEEARCYDTDGAAIPGLYVAGNVQGNRFSIEYPLTVPGLSHSIALTYGRIAGENAVIQK